MSESSKGKEAELVKRAEKGLKKDLNVMKQNFRRSQLLATDTPEAEKMRRAATERKRLQRLREIEERNVRLREIEERNVRRRSERGRELPGKHIIIPLADIHCDWAEQHKVTEVAEVQSAYFNGRYSYDLHTGHQGVTNCNSACNPGTAHTF